MVSDQLLNEAIPCPHDGWTLAQPPRKFVEGRAPGSLKSREEGGLQAVRLLFRERLSPLELGFTRDRLDNDSGPSGAGIVMKNLVFVLVVKTDGVGYGKFDERAPEISSQSRKRRSEGGKNLARRYWRQQDIAAGSPLNAHFLDTFHELQKTLKPEITLTKGGPLLERTGQELRLYIRSRKRAVAMRITLLNDAHEQLPRLRKIEVEHP